MSNEPPEAIIIRCTNCNQEITILRSLAEEREGLCSVCYSDHEIRGVISNV